MTYLRRNKSKTLFALALLSANLSPCNAATALPVTIAQQQSECKGAVLDVNGDPIIGASVTATVNGQKKGAITDLNGYFTIPGVKPGTNLTISYIGYKTQHAVWNGKELNISLAEDAGTLDDVVVVGYGSQKKVNLTGAVSVVNSKSLQSRAVTSVAQALQGAVPGLNFNVSNSGGALNGKLSMNIRGAGTIGAGSNAAPLVLIDGSEGDLYSISPNDIENISVLKDASSSAIYGSRAAFGVILVTTKSGHDGRVNVNYNGNVRFSTATQVPEMPNSYDFARYWNDAAANNGEAAPFDNDMLERIKNNINGTPKPGEEVPTVWRGYAANEPWGMYTSSWANTDWFKEMYRKGVPSQEHNVSVSGGSKNVNYYLSGALLDQHGLIRHGKDVMRRYNFSSKVSAKLTNWITVTYNTKWSRENYSRPSYMTGLFFHNIARRWPTNPVYDPHGHYVHGNEILQMESGGLDRTSTDKLYQ